MLKGYNKLNRIDRYSDSSTRILSGNSVEEMPAECIDNT